MTAEGLTSLSGRLDGMTAVGLTSLSGRLDGMTALCAPADGKEIARVIATPVVESAAPAVKLNVQLIPVDGADSGRTDEMRVLAVDSFQLLTLAELVKRWRRWFLIRPIRS